MINVLTLTGGRLVNRDVQITQNSTFSSFIKQFEIKCYKMDVSISEFGLPSSTPILDIKYGTSNRVLKGT